MGRSEMSLLSAPTHYSGSLCFLESCSSSGENMTSPGRLSWGSIYSTSTGTITRVLIPCAGVVLVKHVREAKPKQHSSPCLEGWSGEA